MDADANPRSEVELAAEIVIAYIEHHSIEAARIPSLLQEVRHALQVSLSGTQAGSSPPRLVESQPLPVAPDAAAIAASITPDFLISFEDGKPYRSLRRHLMARYGLTPEAYRRRWGLPDDYPMVAPSYARERSEVAQRIGLGRTASANAPRSARAMRAGAKPSQIKEP